MSETPRTDAIGEQWEKVSKSEQSAESHDLYALARRLERELTASESKAVNLATAYLVEREHLIRAQSALSAAEQRATVAEAELAQFKIDGGKAIQFNKERADLAEQRAEALRVALRDLEAALRNDSRGKTISGDDTEYHLDGQAMYQAINKARAAIASGAGEAGNG